MGIKGHNNLIFLGLVILSCMVSSGEANVRHYSRIEIDPNATPLTPTFGIDTLNRSSFPKGFVFGAGSSAYQVEGAWNESGKGLSIWDYFTHRYPEKIIDRNNGDVTSDSYHLYKVDVGLLKAMNMDAYRFSIAWSRILPRGKLNRGVNRAGIAYYNRLINEILVQGLLPYVTLYHWDLPQALEDDYGGFLSPRIVGDYVDFVEVCFKEFGDRVKHWTTFNEPLSFSVAAYDTGRFAPGRCSAWRNRNCTGGNSGTEPYIVTHHQLLAHSAAVRLYKQKYQTRQKGNIGITLLSRWYEPFSNSTADLHAARRMLDFSLGWFMEPLTSGEYPRTMRSILRNRLPRFNSNQSKMVKGSYDFIGINYYTGNYVIHNPNPERINLSFTTDSQAILTNVRNGQLIGVQGGSSWLHSYPHGIRNLLVYIKEKYKSPLIYVTENGIDEIDNTTLTLKQALVDNFRIKHYYGHLSLVRQAIREGVNVMAYFAWALTDNFEWGAGYTCRFGINYVDYNTLKRYPKHSANWFKVFMKK